MKSWLLWIGRTVAVYLALWHFVFILWTVVDLVQGVQTVPEAFHGYLDSLLGGFIVANDPVRAGLTRWAGFGTAAIMVTWFILAKVYEASRKPRRERQ